MSELKEYITHAQEKGSINISEEVVAVIAASAALEVDGIAGLSGIAGREITDILGKKGMSKAVRIQVEDDSITADVYVSVKMGCAVNEVGASVQKRVKSAIESTTGFCCAAVNVHIISVSLNK